MVMDDDQFMKLFKYLDNFFDEVDARFDQLNSRLDRIEDTIRAVK